MSNLPKLRFPALSSACLAALGTFARAAELPVPCAPGMCQSGAETWLASGEASAAIAGNTLTIRQTSDNAVLNWQSFNISADGAVTFDQPDAGAIALNRIFQADPSRILGALNADGRVYLLNQNGIIFGQGAQVNVAGLVASTLDMTPEALERGIAGAISAPDNPNSPAFRLYQNGAPSEAIVVERGASITTSEGGQVLMFAPRIEQRGDIRTPGGQTMLAAGTTVYLAVSDDENLRGLLVEVDAADALQSSVTNGAADDAALAEAVGQIVAERGNVTLAGLAVNQHGRVSATTSVRQNGSIRLQARTGTLTTPGGDVRQNGVRGGELTLGPGSRTEVTLVADASETTVDANEQPRSRVELVGAAVEILEASRVTATGGDIVVKAREDQSGTGFGTVQDNPGATPDASRVYVARDAVLDVSGAQVELPMERNVVRVELRGNELRDSPVQRDGPLRGQAVFVDIRRSGTREDGTPWQGTALADVSGHIAALPRSVAERNLLGGAVLLQSQGDVILAAGATVDVSGGSASYADGFINTTSLLAANGSVVHIGDADPNQQYQRTITEYVRRHERWGVTETFPGFANLSPGSFEPGYVEGYDAGTVTLLAPHAILDGDLVGAVTRGVHQREPTAPLTAGARRPYDQVPRGASLVLGRTSTGAPQLAMDPVSFVSSGALLPTMLNDAGLPFDPRVDMLPRDFASLSLRTDLFGEGRIASATIISSSWIELGADRALRLPDGGELSLLAPRVEIHGSIDVASGKVGATAERSLGASGPDDRSLLVVGPTARITARGRWINEDPRSRPDTANPPALHIDGGEVSLVSTAGDLLLHAGSLIDVSAGAHRPAEGAVIGGRGGTISLESRPVSVGDALSPSKLELGATLDAHALLEGGTLKVTAGEICIAPVACDGQTAQSVHLTPEQLAGGGFGSFDLRSNNGGIQVEGPLALRQRNLELAADAMLRPSGASILEFARSVVLDDLVRRPVDLSLRVSAPSPLEQTRATFATAPALEIGVGARIEADPNAVISLQANTRVAIDGNITAPAGNVSIILDETLNVGEFLDSQAITLGQHASIDVRGTARIASTDGGIRRGEVLDGGEVVLEANRGYVVLNPGSRIDVSGADGVLDVRASATDPRLLPVRIGSAAGTIDIVAAEGALLAGELVGAAGSGSGIAGLRPRGGTLRLALDPGSRSDPNAGQAGVPSLFPTGARTITLGQSGEALVIGAGSPVPAALNGHARVAADAVMAGGFDSLLLEADVLGGNDGFGQFITVPGVVRFEGDVALALPARIDVHAARLDVHGAAALLEAPYVTLGNADPNWQGVLNVQGGTGSLAVRGDFIEVVGQSVIDGAATTRLESAGDLRLRGLELPASAGSAGLVGSLATAGDLTLAADQVYATTLTDFELAVRDNPAGVLAIASSGDAPKDLLSAASTLRLTAPTIEQGGVLRAPFGTIRLDADTLTLQPGSVTSTSADGLVIPFGTTQGGFDWVYDLANVDFVYGADHQVPPAQNVLLEGRSIDIQPGATIDLSGGGDLLAYEFIPGVNGSRDVLASTERPNEFAIVPSLDIRVAPFDAREYAGSPLRPGDSIRLEAGSGLPAGEYVLLPARYALLPGAFLVRAVDGYQDIGAADRFMRLDGSTVVSGYRLLAGTSIGDSRRSGFAVRPAELARREAEYTVTRANEFFAAQADALGRSPPRLPRDGGVLALNAAESLVIDGELRASAAEGGRGAAVDIASTRLRVAAADTAPSAGEVVVDAESLNRLGAESILLGGRRSSTGDGTRLDVASENVTIAADVSAPELLVAARDTVRVEPGATVTGVTADADTPSSATGAAGRRYLIDGDAALLRVAGGAQAAVERTGETGALGTLDIAATATLDAGAGSILLDATRDTSLLGELHLAGGSLNLGASRITLGADGVAAAGLVLTADDLARLEIDELVLTSRSTVDLTGDVALDVSRLVVDAAGLQGAGADSMVIRADESIRFTNTADTTFVPTGTPGSILSLHAGNVELGPGTFDLAGFSDVSLITDGALTFEDGAALRTGGNLAWTGARVVGRDGAAGSIAARGVLSLGRSAAPGAAAAGSAGVGAKLALTASRIEHDATIDLPGGSASLHATEDAIALGADAVIDVRGVARSFDGVAVAAPGGSVTLVSDSGDVLVAAGATIDARGAAEGGDAGSIVIGAARGNVALDGVLLGNGIGNGARGGSLDIDAQSFGGYEAVADRAAAGGFTAALGLRQRGAGDIVVDGALQAADVKVVAEQGNVRVTGSIDASGEAGGRVRLAASDSVTVDGSITARASGDGQRGGTVELLAENGGVRVNGGASIDVTGAEGGTILARLPGGRIVDTLLDADAGNDELVLAGALTGARAVTVEGYQAYDEADGVLDSADVAADAANPRYADAAAFMAQAAAVRAALGRAGDASFRIVPGVEIRSPGNLTLAADWDLGAWRLAGAPGSLTLRAAGDLLFDASLSDGFDGVAGAAAFRLAVEQPTESWSYRLVGGAAHASADPLALRDPADALPAGIGAGDVRVGPGTSTAPRMIRTGTGSIEIAAANDFVLDNQQSVVYTAGVSGPGKRFGTGNNTLGQRAYPVNGGDITITAGRDVRGARTNQFVNDWLWRVGSSSPSSAVAWTVNFQEFEQNVGALGGGNVRIAAGGDVTNFSVSIPSIGRQAGEGAVANIPFRDSALEVVGGGDLDVRAGGSILGGSYYVGRGSARLAAGDAVGAVVRQDGSESSAPLLGLGDGTLSVLARADLTVAGIVNPSLLPPGFSQLPLGGNVRAQRSAYFASYADDTGADLRSVAGDLTFVDDSIALSRQLSSMFPSGEPTSVERLAFGVAPPSLRAAALSGDVVLDGTLVLFPAPKGNVELFAQQNVRRSPGFAVLGLADTPTSELPTLAAPQNVAAVSRSLPLLTRNGVPPALRPFLNAPVPTHADANQPDGVPDSTPARIVAAEGDIDLRTQGSGDQSTLYFSKPVRVIAGGDIIDLPLQAQHLRDSDVSVLSAGRDIIYTASRHPTGQLLPNTRRIAIDGPGLLEISAGRDVDLQTSAGIETRGNLDNPFLPAGGAGISIMAGLNGRAPDYEAFVQRYFTGDSEHAAELREYVEQLDGTSGLSFDEALARFRALDPSRQRPLIERVLVAELRAAGREAAVSGDRDDFEAGFEALETLFPGSNPDAESGEANAYAGDIRLFFSRIYTLAGGDISVFAPGGEINVGLATPPQAFGIGKSPAELGMVVQQRGSVAAVAYGDFHVNESRVFAADGGDILVWSTDGDIDAGRGAKTAISAPPPTITVDSDGRITVLFPAALAGSGIQTLATTAGRKPGNVDLFAPRGVVNAGDAGIVAGNLTIAATAVLGADNIQVSGVAVGVPVATDGLGAALSGVSAVASSASNAAAETVAAPGDEQRATPLADEALGFLEVFVTGFGEACDAAEQDCEDAAGPN